ncbi:hypothetical protein, partial [Clostridium sp. ZBS2]|uniref:hypothetical protein n=1 Tax=Clostridium sp. ZBS2 TaxID=2949976 RepID=UPI0020792F0D
YDRIDVVAEVTTNSTQNNVETKTLEKGVTLGEINDDSKESVKGDRLKHKWTVKSTRRGFGL